MELPIFNTYMNFSRHQLCCFTVVPLFVLDKSMAWNRCLQLPCFKNLCKIAQASKNSDSNAQHFLSDFANTFMISLHALCTPMLPNPLSIMNRCLHLTLHPKFRQPIEKKKEKRRVRGHVRPPQVPWPPSTSGLPPFYLFLTICNLGKKAETESWSKTPSLIIGYIYACGTGVLN
jgi:hypothetical protein